MNLKNQIAVSLPNPKSFITVHKFPGGEIQVAVVYVDGWVVHAYRLHRTYGSDQWYAPIKSDAAGAATRLAYGKDKVAGRQKTALEVWNEMLPYLEPIPRVDDL